MTHQEALRKAIACLKLSQSPNEAEAALAAAKAQEIIDKYKLDVTSVDFEQQEKQRDDEPIQDFWNDPLDNTTNNGSRWSTNLASVISRVNQCRILVSHGANAHGTRIGVIGRPSDVQTVRYVYAWLKREVERLCKENTGGNSGTYKRHYCLGVVDTIGRKLREQQKATQATATTNQGNNPFALVLVKNAIVKIQQRDQAVQKFVDDKYKSKSRASQEQIRDTGGRSHGQRDGHNVRFNAAKTGINNGSANKQVSSAR